MFPRPTLCKTHAPCFCCMGFDTGGLRLLDRPWRTLVSPLDLLVDRKFSRPSLRYARCATGSAKAAPTIEWLDQKGDRTGWVFNRFLLKLPALPLRHSVSTRLLPWAFPMPDTLPVYAACLMLPPYFFLGVGWASESYRERQISLTGSTAFA